MACSTYIFLGFSSNRARYSTDDYDYINQMDHHTVFQPPSSLQIPSSGGGGGMTSSDSAFSLPGSMSSSSSQSSLSSPSFCGDPETDLAKAAQQAETSLFQSVPFRSESQV